MHEYAAVIAAKVGLDSELSAAVRRSDPERFQTNALALEATNASSIAAREAIREHETKVHAAPAFPTAFKAPQTPRRRAAENRRGRPGDLGAT
jgi:hypothetical protein